MLRLILCVVIAAASLMTGMYLSARLNRRERTLVGFIGLLREAKTRIAYRYDSLASAFSDNFLGNEFSAAEPFVPQWEAMADMCRDSLTADDIAFIKSFAGELGSSDVDTQLSRFDYYISSLGEHLNDAKRETASKASVYRALPFAAGMAAVIMIM